MQAPFFRIGCVIADCNRSVANAWCSEKNADEAVGMTSDTITERKRATFYWLATALLVSDLVLGGIWDVLRVPRVREVIERLGYPTYFLVILGVSKLLGAQLGWSFRVFPA